ncbi:probable non-F420 flavinoid oxidoreductase [Nitrosospira sp. Nl5]|uniref:TIGR03885 family FMN-dependent LLM class oxidoreductase n=1 Tax=Nitrosospira sp. Nl5 TaxID=200120 RepID=UPI000882C9BB|nr:TIGR03885 family FMN-dependent LLM class oxidoreductase [Nitrosospira sp. Nl5]SCY70297.1 probable non-F420 flavinoid oxidoreductase [Nitrosospira sp. Nl5]
MPFLGYHASQEQFSPSELLKLVKLAEQNHFQEVMTSDHFQPWSTRQGQAGFTWSWLGSALEATKMNFGSIAIPGGWRYSPPILAQAVATLCEMYSGRFNWIATGSGEALNEQIMGLGWPDKTERNERLRKGVNVMRALWKGEELEDIKLWTCPPSVPKVLAAVLTPDTARLCGEWADGIITINQEHDKLKEIITAFVQGGGEGKEIYLQLHLSYARSGRDASDWAYHQWRSNALEPAQSEEISSVKLYDEMSEKVRPEEMHKYVRISADVEQHTNWIKEYLGLGIQGIFLHNVGRNQEEFIKTFGEKVLPEFQQEDHGAGLGKLVR